VIEIKLCLCSSIFSFALFKLSFNSHRNISFIFNSHGKVSLASELLKATQDVFLHQRENSRTAKLASEKQNSDKLNRHLEQLGEVGAK